MRLGVPLVLPQHSDQHRPQDPVLLAVDQELAVRRGLPVRPPGNVSDLKIAMMDLETTECGSRLSPAKGSLD
jgi:hypothetical protein